MSFDTPISISSCWIRGCVCNPCPSARSGGCGGGVSSGVADMRASEVKPCAGACLPRCRSRAWGKGGQRPLDPPQLFSAAGSFRRPYCCVRPLAGFALLYGINTGNALACRCAVPRYFSRRRVRRNHLGLAIVTLLSVARSRLIPSRPAGRLFTVMNGEAEVLPSNPGQAAVPP